MAVVSCSARYRMNAPTLRRVLRVLISAVCLPLAAAAQDYPVKPIRIVLGFPPAGSGDTLVRVMQPEVSRLLGQPLIVEHRPGAGTNLASEFVARSAPDGYTLLLGGNFSHSVNPALYPKLGYDPQKDFAPVLKLTSSSGVFVVPASLPVNSLREFIAYAKREGSRVNYASSGIGSPTHIAGAYFNKIAGLDMTHIPYKGAGDVARDLSQGDIQLAITSVTAVQPLVKQGKARMLALTTPGASRQAPGVPGSDEAGLPTFKFDAWYGVFAPAGASPAVVAKLFDAFRGALNNPETAARIEGQGLLPDPSASPETFARFMREDAKVWVEMVRLSGASVQ